MKNIIVCCDGTANEFAKDRTNVVKLFYTLEQSPRQSVYYHPGLGTMAAMGALTMTTKKVTKLLGLAIGYGLEADVRDAYTFLMREFKEGDRIFLFGFSRGAYTVRVVASLLHMYGLLPANNEPFIPYAIRMLVAIHSQKGGKDLFDLARSFKETFSRRECKPYFVGVWDTVSSVGWLANPLAVPYSAFNPDISIARHAVSIDERRAFFRQNLWRPDPSQPEPDIKQVWFPGVHCDVGGGYPEEDSGLSKIALEWMLAEAQAAGLLLDEVRLKQILGKAGNGSAVPDPNALMHKSLTPCWWPAEFILKKHFDFKSGKDGRQANLFRRRFIPDGSLIHDSVFQRRNYAPPLPSTAVRTSTLSLL